MIIEIQERENMLHRLLKWLRGEMQTISDGEQLHFKGVGNTLRHKKEVGDYLVFVSNDPYRVRKSALCTYQIIDIDDNKAYLELLEYNVLR